MVDRTPPVPSEPHVRMRPLIGDGRSARMGGTTYGTKSLISGAIAAVPALCCVLLAALTHLPEAVFMIVGAILVVGGTLALVYAIASLVQCARGKEDSMLPALGGILLALSPFILLILLLFTGYFGHCGPPDHEGGRVSPPRSARTRA